MLVGQLHLETEQKKKEDETDKPKKCSTQSVVEIIKTVELDFLNIHGITQQHQTGLIILPSSTAIQFKYFTHFMKITKIHHADKNNAVSQYCTLF